MNVGKIEGFGVSQAKTELALKTYSKQQCVLCWYYESIIKTLWY